MERRLKLAILLGIGTCPVSVFAQQKAFPEAEGFGRFATGARTNLSAATVYRVTNLNDSGPGSFRDAVSQSNRFVVFEVGGIINLDSTVVVKNNITIAGQTAPGGISLYGQKVSFSAASNTISRYIAIRKGQAGIRDDASGASNGANMMFDHMSVTWGVDETFSLNWDGKGSSLDNITIQNSVVGQGLDRLGHSAGGLMTLPEGGRFSVIGSLFTDNVTRNPKVRGENEFINNVVYGWESAAYIMGDTVNMTSHANVIGNYFIRGPVASSGPFSSGTPQFNIYGSGNYFDSNQNGVLDGTLVTSYPGATVVATPFNFPTVANYTAQEAVQQVMANAGLSITRDAVDSRLMQEVASYGTLGGVILRETDVFPGYGTDPQYVNVRARLRDSDNDGMPDNWETARGLNPNNGTDWKNLNGGYTRLEEYLNELGGNGTNRVATSGTWSVAGNWSGAVPTFADQAFIRGDGAGSNGNVSISQVGAAARQLFIGGAGPAAGERLTVATGGTLDVFDTLHVGHQNNATLAVTGGTVSAGRVLLGAAGTTGTLSLTGGSLQTGVIAAGGNAVIDWNGGTLRALGAPDVSVNATLGAAGGTFDTNGYNGAFSGNLSGAGNFTKTGVGNLSLTGTNTYTGKTTIQGGTLVINSLTDGGVAGNLGAASTDTANLVFDGGTLQVLNSSSTNRGLTVAAGGGALQTNGTSTMTIGGSIVASGNGARTLTIEQTGGTTTTSTFTGAITDTTSGKLAVTKTGAGRLSFSGTAKNYSGDTTIDAGTLLAFATNVLPNGTDKGNLIVNSGATADLRFNQNINGLSGAGTLTNNDTTRTRDLVLGNGNASGNFGGTINARLNIIKTGAGTQTFSGMNTYDGATTVNAGVLAVSNLGNGAAASGIGDSSSAAENLVLDGGTFRYVGAATSSDRLFSVGGNGGAIESSGTGTLTLAGPGPVAMIGTGNRTFTLGGTNTGFNNFHLDLGDSTNGTTSLTKDGAGTWRLFGASKTYSGDTRVKAGALYLVGGNMLPFGNGKGNVTVDAAASIDVYGNSQSFNGLNGGGTITTTINTARTLTVGNGHADGAFAGRLTNGSSQTLHLTKTGSGVQILSGNSDYRGLTTVNGGTLIVNGTHTNGSTYTVNGSATLGGSGTIASDVSVSSGGAISPGNSAGVLSIGSLSLASGADLLIELNGSTNHDQLSVTGTANVAGADLLASLNFIPQSGDTLLILRNDGIDPIVGNFAGLSEGALFDLQSSVDQQFHSFQITYLANAELGAATGGNDVLLTSVPEPSAALTLLTMCAGGLISRRRRQGHLANARG